MTNNDPGPANVILFDARPQPDSGMEKFTGHLETLGLQANLLSPVLELNPRVTWHSKGYLNFSSYVGVGGWFIYGETGEAQYNHSANEALWNLEIWFTDLNPALYLLVVEVECYGTIGSGPRFLLRGPGGTSQTVNSSPSSGRQYLGTLFAAGSGLTLVTLQPLDIQTFGFFRATLVDVFG
jgi:hypothetical protein